MTKAVIALVGLAACSSAMAQVPIPPHASTYNGFSRGYNFTANTSFVITQLALPTEAFQAGDTASYMVRVNGAEALRSVGNAGAIATNVAIASGDIVDIIGNWSPAVTGNFSAHNSYTASMASFNTTIEGVAHSIRRTGWQWDIGDPGYLSGAYLTPTSGAMGRIFMFTAVPTPGTLALVGAGGLLALRRRR